jgi:RimJ/RimL family protein N-acetyltransferase
MVILTPFQRSDFDRLISWIGNKELLVTIAGTQWMYPLTTEQLEVYLADPRSHAFNIVDKEQNVTVGHAELVLDDDGTCKIDKLIIGDPAYRGKGLCQQVMKELMAFAFTKLPIHTVELNVFDWNSAAVRCYEKVGFQFNAAKKQTFEIDDQTWIALNMSIRKSNWKAGLPEA